jgi:hypothetical protein
MLRRELGFSSLYADSLAAGGVVAIAWVGSPAVTAETRGVSGAVALFARGGTDKAERRQEPGASSSEAGALDNWAGRLENGSQ